MNPFKCHEVVVFLAYESTILYTHVIESPCGLVVKRKKCISLYQLQYCNISCVLAGSSVGNLVTI